MSKKLNFEKICGTDRQKNILFKLLKQRKYRISHSHIPDINLHNKFVENHPYRAWYIVFEELEEIGTFYIKFDNSIGLNLIMQSKENIDSILKFVESNFSPEREVSSLIPPYFYLNIASDNAQLQCILEEMGIYKLQISYRIWPKMFIDGKQIKSLSSLTKKILYKKDDFEFTQKNWCFFINLPSLLNVYQELL